MIPAADFAPGTVLADRYRIVSVLGRGGMGEVYRAEDLMIGEVVALKFLPRHLATDPARVAQLIHEVRIGRQISHPNVCRIHDIGEVNGRHYLSMEYIDGEDLASLLRRVGRLSSDKAREIARQLCAGLAAAHAKGVLHRDLKPANVMIDGRGHARITDFGLAVISDRARAEEVAGTPAYIAPEQLAGEVASVRSDLFSLGLVLYQLFAGRRLYSVTTLDERRRLDQDSAVTGRLLGAPTLDRLVDQVVRQCLERDPERRPDSASSIAGTLAVDQHPTELGIESLTSPATIRDSPDIHGLRPRVAWAVLGAIIAGTLAIASGPLALRSSDLPIAPQMLAARAQQLLASIGYEASHTDNAFWFSARTPRFFLRRSGAIQFVYRQSPPPLLPKNLFRVVTEDDPPTDIPGRATVTLDSQGQLVGFNWLRNRHPDDRLAGQEPDWPALFELAGLNIMDFLLVNPDNVPVLPHDSLTEWQGTGPSGEIHVDAASLGGKAVSFQVHDGTVPSAPRGNVLVIGLPIEAELFFWTLVVLAFAASAALGRRNLRMGIGDRASARKMAVFVACTGSLYAILRAHHVPSALEEITFVLAVSGWVLVWTAFCWMIYIAIEPYVQRRWPAMLMSWVRLLQGRVRDPRVGRDVLFGVLAGIVLTALDVVHGHILDRTAASVSAFAFRLEPLHSSRHFLAAIAFHLADTLQFALAGLFFFLLLRLIVANKWIASAIWVAMATAVGAAVLRTSGGTPLGWSSLFAVAVALLFLLVLFRVSFLAVVLMLIVQRLMTAMPITLDPDAWFLGSSVVILLLVVGAAVYGFLVALAGRSALAGSPL